MNIFFNTFYFCSFFFKWAGLRAGLRAGPNFGPAARPAHKRARARPGLKRAAGRGLFGDPQEQKKAAKKGHVRSCDQTYFWSKWPACYHHDFKNRTRPVEPSTDQPSHPHPSPCAPKPGWKIPSSALISSLKIPLCLAFLVPIAFHFYFLYLIS